MHRVKSLFPVLLLAMVMSACQTLGTPPVDTFGKRVIVANAIAEQAAVTSERLYSAGKISLPTKDGYVDRIKTFAAGIDTAESMRGTKPEDANAKLLAIIAGLNALANELDSKERP